MKKKILTLLLLFSVLMSVFGCESIAPTENAVVCASFPQYDLARQICGDTATVIMLLPTGSEAHDFEPSARDIKTVELSKLFIYNGGESDGWINRMLESTENINALSLIDCTEKDVFVDGHHGAEKDEHIWTSPKNMILMANKIYVALCEAFPDKTETLKENLDKVVSDLTDLDRECQLLGERLKGETVIIGDRNPFVYFASEYGIEMLAAFNGCGHESEPSAAELASLTKKAKELGTKYVFYVDFSGGRLAKTIADGLDGAVAVNIFSCHNVSKEYFNTKTYVDIMKENIEKMEKICNGAD